MKPTPGPWSYNMKGCPTSHGLPIIIDGRGHLLACMADARPANPKHIVKAVNAHDDLMEALYRVSNLSLSNKTDPKIAEAVRFVRATLAHVEGQFGDLVRRQA